jgi:hypothetical protein
MTYTRLACSISVCQAHVCFAPIPYDPYYQLQHVTCISSLDIQTLTNSSWAGSLWLHATSLVASVASMHSKGLDPTKQSIAWDPVSASQWISVANWASTSTDSQMQQPSDWYLEALKEPSMREPCKRLTSKGAMDRSCSSWTRDVRDVRGRAWRSCTAEMCCPRWFKEECS